MFLTIIGPAGYRESVALDSRGFSLGQIFAGKEIDAVLINGRASEDWQPFIPGQGDRIQILSRGGAWFAALPAIIQSLISSIISLALSFIIKALTPKPKQPRQQQRAASFGIAGFNNTTGPGTPKFVPYGRNRVAGHVISSSAEISEDGHNMLGKVLYFMGDMGGDGCGGINDVQINDLPFDQYEGVEIDTRPGTDDQTVMQGFEDVTELLLVGQQIPDDATPIIIVTKSDTVQKAKLFFQFSGGLFSTSKTGKIGGADATFRVEQKLNSDTIWIESHSSPITFHASDQSQIFRVFEIIGLTAGKWNFRITSLNGPVVSNISRSAILFNIEEIQFTTLTYPGSALLGVFNIPSKQVQSFDSMKVTALVDGKCVKVPTILPDDSIIFDLIFTRQRAWIVRDMLTHKRVGMGNEIEESEIPDAQWKEDAQDYWDELVASHPGEPDEPRDLCDVIINEFRWDWEWIKSVLGEGRGRIYPSWDQWRLAVDKPGSPNLLYSFPGNIIEDSLKAEIAVIDRPFNQVIAEYRNADDDYHPDIPEPITDPDIGSEPVIQDQLSYETITRESQIQRENMLILKRAKLERRRWSFTSPMGAIVSEPMDLDYLVERFPGEEDPATGFLPAGSTASTIMFSDPVLIKPVETYMLIVKHQKDNTVETRTVSTTEGTWSQINVASPFAQAPAEGDIFALVIVSLQDIVTRAQDLEIDDQGNVKQLRTEYVPAVYTQDPLPPKSARRFFRLMTLPPVPLRDARVSEEVVVARDGSQFSTLNFYVTPGLDKNSGLAQAGFPTGIALAITEPRIEGYFVGAYMAIVAGTGAGQIDRRITAYSPPGAAFFAQVSPAWTTQPDNTSVYQIEWRRFGEFLGFKVEASENGSAYREVARAVGTHWEQNARDQIGTVTYRFTPFSNGNIENLMSRIEKTITLQGDRSAPAVPIAVALSTHLKNISIDIRCQRPTAEDLAGFEAEYWDANPVTPQLLRVVKIPVSQDSATSGIMVRQHLESFDSFDYGRQFIARVRAYDFSNNFSNYSAWSNIVILQQIATADIGPAALTDFAEFVRDDPDTDIDGVFPNFVDIGGISFLSAGGPIAIHAVLDLDRGTGQTPTGDWQATIFRGDVVSGTEMDSKVILTGDPIPSIVLQKIDWPTAGTYQYRFGVRSAIAFNVNRCRFYVLEIKDHTQ